MSEREILFRGKRVDNGEWIEGFAFERLPPLQCIGPETEEESEWYIVKTGFADWNMPRPAEFKLVDPSAVGQYTGLKDKNGKRIFEGDIVAGVSYSTYRRGVIVWIDKIAGFGVRYYHRTIPTAWENSSILKLMVQGRTDEFAAEVIGNIHDNPELLESAQ